jgi:N-acetylglutamate synthase/N-acetylornithine aminotransferase
MSPTRTPEEADELFEKLATYEAVASADAAPPGTEMAQLVAAAAAAVEQRDTTEARVEQLSALLEKARAALAAADAKDDVVAIAKHQAELAVVRERLSAAEAEVASASEAATTAATARDAAWGRIVGAIGMLRTCIPADRPSLSYRARGPWAWATLVGLLDVGASELDEFAKVGPHPRLVERARGR